MLPRLVIDTAIVPGGAEMRLVQRGRDWFIMLGREELMSSRMSGSEEALATLACDRVGADARLLIGGYGMGFTLRAALAQLGPKAHVAVAELVPAVIAWARGPMTEIAAGCLDDPRVEIVLDDVGAVIAASPRHYDAILLDVDNGPDGLTRADNDRLYSAGGLAVAKAALRPGGLLTIWSAAPDPAFARALVRAGFRVEEVAIRARASGKGARHVIWIASI
ncbi:spermidine synthase [Hephaestia sp. GCM10023244]|uniref:spermidine synthase n=1 Tax=unclassified Hephaestia TaxID=2631281 RepID=UPI002077619C|nr:spermidine synthase [Hephaestia sp. MAHUQ-44]MCM8729927.1 spermidine synthase [Hephaestia sp. MAHUQ-44]